MRELSLFSVSNPALGPELNEMGSGIGGGGREFGGEICKYRDMNADTKTLISRDLVMPPLSIVRIPIIGR